MKTRSQASPAQEESAETTQTSARTNGNMKESRRRKSREIGALGGEDRSSRDTSEEEALTVEDGRRTRAWDRTEEETTEWIMKTQSASDNATNPVFTAHTKQTRPRPKRRRSPWGASALILLVTAFATFFSFSIIQAFLSRQKDPDGCRMSYMSAGFVAYPDFDTEHTRFASKYSLYLYREVGIDDDARVRGVPVLFIPGNAGSYKQVRSLASESAVHFQNVLQSDTYAFDSGKRSLDWFTVDFNEDLAAFHGQTLLDQAEYLNEVIGYILQLYHNPHQSVRDSSLPDPTSVVLVGHSMGGIVARTMLTLSNYQPDTVNTIVTLAAPHSRPPVSFDAEVLHTYQRVNDYWRNAYLEKLPGANPLREVTLVSIAGGGLDTIVASDYATLASLVPAKNGFTVFTSTIPHVWTGMDHLAMVWCDQLRKSVVRSLYDVIDARRPPQTRTRGERMSSFSKWLLTGLEDIKQKRPTQVEPRILLTLGEGAHDFMPVGERLVLQELGARGKSMAYLLPVPAEDPLDRKRLTILSHQSQGLADVADQLDIMFCSVIPSQQLSSSFSINIDLSGGNPDSSRLACRSAADDTTALPASTNDSRHPFDEVQPFSYLQVDLEQLVDYQFVAIVDRLAELRSGWVIAEFATISESKIETTKTLSSMIASGIDVTTAADHPFMMEITIASLQSSLLAYKLNIDTPSCDEPELFAPLVRQYISDPHESKFFVNAREVEVSMHGVAPYLPPPLEGNAGASGLGLQIWSSPTCNSSMHISLKVDIPGSMGKLWMRYRTAFAAFPLLIVALVLRKQFKTYDDSGIFMSFSEGLDMCLRTSVPVLFVALTLFGISYPQTSGTIGPSLLSWRADKGVEASFDFTQNDLLLGTHDPFFWFLVPLFGVVSIGICVGLNYIALLLTHVLAVIYATILRLLGRANSSFVVSSLRRRLIVTSVLIMLVWTVIPYQFLFIVLCIAQLATCVRALSLARENYTYTNSVDFYNYAHSVLILMLWILPINLPTLVVWIHNLTVHWLTPFSSHHNVLSILPFVLLVETLSTGKMIPRLHRQSISSPPISTSTAQSRGVAAEYHPKLHALAHQATSVLFFAMAAYAAIYGVTYAYVLHHIVNVIAAWLMIVYYASGRESGFRGVARLLENKESVVEFKSKESVDSKSKESVDLKSKESVYLKSKSSRSVVPEHDSKQGKRMDGNNGGKVEGKVP